MICFTALRRCPALGAVLGWLLVSLVLRFAGSSTAQISAALADPQGYVNVVGADEFVLALATAAAWLLLGWVLLGAMLVVGSATPGWCGWLFGGLAKLLLPTTLHRFVSLALGFGLVTGTSVASAAPAAPSAGAIAVTLDWPSAVADPLGPLGLVPDWPPAAAPVPAPVPAPAPVPDPDPVASQGSSSPITYVVGRGDCLWDIAEAFLARSGQPTDVAAVGAAVTAWWETNRSQIADPDVIFPGQVLNAPSPTGRSQAGSGQPVPEPVRTPAANPSPQPN